MVTDFAQYLIGEVEIHFIREDIALVAFPSSWSVSDRSNFCDGCKLIWPAAKFIGVVGRQMGKLNSESGISDFLHDYWQDQIKVNEAVRDMRKKDKGE